MGVTIVPLAHPGDLGVYAPAPQLADMDTARAALPKAYALLDGPMFGAACSSNGRGPGCLQYRLRDRARDVDSAPMYPDRGLTFTVGGIRGQADVVRGSRDEDVGDAPVAIQTYPALVEDGRATGSNEPESVGRAALCLLADGRLAFAAGGGPMRTFAAELARAGVQWAGYTDGGGSTGLLGPGVEIAGNRPVPAWLVAVPRSWIARWWPAVLGVAGALVVSAVVMPRESR